MTVLPSLPLSPRTVHGRRIFLAGMVGLWGAAVAAVIFPDASPTVIGMATFGAVLAGLVFGPLFGRQGWRGLIWMSAAAVGATLSGAAIGAGLMFGPDASPLGAILVMDMIATSPAALLIWGGGLVAVRLSARAVSRGYSS